MAETKPNAAAKASTSKGGGNAISYLAPIICVIAGYVVWRFVLGNPDGFSKPDELGGFWPSHKGPTGAWNKMYEGGIIVPLLIGCLFMVIVFSIERFLTISKATGTASNAEFVRKVQFELANKNVDAAIALCDKQKGSVGNVMKAGLKKYKEMISSSEFSTDQKVAA
ncbi:MAG: MotA/TolQ/ExbB proton channel family protein, partial [Chitinophagaceae bacterium]|nr:MotA/TolQ/ExbB proton channel family protein [Chitinophagaceae bacterium]